ncbi:MAG: glycoside hydrolase family 9 protein [Lachnospiraceae bacterium]|nr:glycoside hydrolase family 9 protein [Lachnospiraceae bacterium]
MRLFPPARRVTAVIICAALTAALAGCGKTVTLRADSAAEETGGDAPAAQAGSAEETGDKEQRQTASAFSMSADRFYKRQIPGILIDQNGYAAEEMKIAVFCGETLPAAFEVRDDETDAVVWTGELRARSRSEDGKLQLATGDFTQFSEDGRYYLYAQRLGESCSFTVGGTTHETLLENLQKRYYFNRCGISLTEEYAGEHAHGVCHSTDATLAGDAKTLIDVTGGWHMNERADRFAVSAAEIVENLLLAYELNPDAFGDDTGIPESGNGVPDVLDEARVGISWLLKMQNAKTGGVYASALTRTGIDGNLANASVEVQPVSREATIAFASALAKFSYSYRHFDSTLATTCLRASDRAFGSYLQSLSADMSADDEAFTAAAELYRATGGQEYREILEAFFAAEDFFDRAITEPHLFFGTVTYLQTGQAVDFGVSDRLMKALTLTAEAVAADSNRSIYGAAFDGTDEEQTVTTLLHDMRILAVSDHVSYSYEYTKLLSEHLHALCGRNPEAGNYLSGFSGDAATAGYPGVLNQPVENAALAAAVAMLLAEGY